MYFIAIDVGSSYVKSVLWELASQTVLEKRRVPTPEKEQREGESIHETDARALFTLVKEIIDSCRQRYHPIAGVLFSTQMHGCVLEHPEYDKDIYISWQDARCLGRCRETDRTYIEELEQKIPLALMRRTGLAVKPALALCNLYTLFRDNPLNRKIPLYTLGSYFIRQLTGHNICHISNAAPMGFVDIRTGEWIYELLELAGLAFLELPRITRSLECCGFYHTEQGDIPIFPDIGDVQASVLGSGAKAGDLVANIATAGQLILLSDQPAAGGYEIRPFFDGLYCRVVSRMPSGRTLDVQIDYIREIGERVFGIKLTHQEIWRRLLPLVNQEDTQGLRVDVGFYELPDRLADGGIYHITRSNLTLSNLWAATLEDFAQVYKKHADALCAGESTGGRLLFCGGAAVKNEPLMRRIAARLGRAEYIVSEQEEVYNGMLQLALACTGMDSRPTQTI